MSPATTAQGAVAKATMYQIGEVAERVGLSLRTVRYYEEMELISPEMRTEGGFRLYTDDHVDRLALIKGMKPLGFSVAEMRELLDARDSVASLDADDPKRRAAAERLRGFSRDVQERAAKLRQQLAAGEVLAKQLSRESRRRRKVSRRS